MTAVLSTSSAAADSLYAQLGGDPAVRRLVDQFYALMDQLPEAWTVRRLHPEDLSGSADSLFKFLSGWFGGPSLFVRERGHPRLRMRHAPYAIGPTERDEWMLCMHLALEMQVKNPTLREVVERAFAGMADHLVNAVGTGPC